MPKRVPVQTIVVHREGKRITPKIGEAFDFTAEELADLNRVNPDCIRKVVIEDKELEDEFESDEKAAEKAAAAPKGATTAKAAAAAKTSAGDL